MAEGNPVDDRSTDFGNDAFGVDTRIGDDACSIRGVVGLASGTAETEAFTGLVQQCVLGYRGDLCYCFDIDPKVGIKGLINALSECGAAIDGAYLAIDGAYLAIDGAYLVIDGAYFAFPSSPIPGCAPTDTELQITSFDSSDVLGDQYAKWNAAGLPNKGYLVDLGQVCKKFLNCSDSDHGQLCLLSGELLRVHRDLLDKLNSLRSSVTGGTATPCQALEDAKDYILENRTSLFDTPTKEADLALEAGTNPRRFDHAERLISGQRKPNARLLDRYNAFGIEAKLYGLTRGLSPISHQLGSAGPSASTPHILTPKAHMASEDSPRPQPAMEELD